MQDSLHTIDLLELALDKIAKSGVEIKREWLQGMPAGLCRIGTRRCLYLDQSQTALEQLATAMECLASVQKIV